MMTADVMTLADEWLHSRYVQTCNELQQPFAQYGWAYLCRLTALVDIVDDQQQVNLPVLTRMPVATTLNVKPPSACRRSAMAMDGRAQAQAQRGCA